MFARPRPKKLALGAPPKKRKISHAVEEIKFDDDARQEYLTGFHKRKLQRAKNAQEQAAKRAREEKLELRKQIRDQRKKEVEDHVQQVNAILKEAASAGYVGGTEDASDDEAQNEEWGGFEDAPVEEPVDHEEEYVDEERYTTVTVESVNVSKDGMTSSKPEGDSDQESEAEAGDQELQKSSDNVKGHPPKKKKPKFRYETKAERQFSQRKQKARNKRKRG